MKLLDKRNTSGARCAVPDHGGKKGDIQHGFIKHFKSGFQTWRTDTCPLHLRRPGFESTACHIKYTGFDTGTGFDR